MNNLKPFLQNFEAQTVACKIAFTILGIQSTSINLCTCKDYKKIVANYMDSYRSLNFKMSLKYVNNDE